MLQPRSPCIGILQYGAGNVGSVQRALTRLRVSWRVIEDAEELQELSGLIVPGVGAAKAAMDCLCNRGLTEPLRAFDRPFLGLCLGMQLLFERSEEGPVECLGVIKGVVRGLSNSVTKPHMGWNMLRQAQHDTALGYAYFVHSYACIPDSSDVITMTVQYGNEVCAGVRQENFFGVQWHPEKSGEVGDRYLLSFTALCR